MIVKVALLVSPAEQKARLRERLERPDKYWKFNPGDIDERAKWPAYREAYQAVLDRTSTEHAPWYAVPADNKWYARLAVGRLLRDALEGLHLGWPPADFDVEEELARLDAQRSERRVTHLMGRARDDFGRPAVLAQWFAGLRFTGAVSCVRTRRHPPKEKFREV